ncbi:MAG: sugar phosphate isomerase/epimerase [Bryobacteraceae bacterium]
MQRRQFLLTPALLAAKPAYAPTLSGAAYVFTQWLGREKRSLASGLDEIFGGFREAGYRQVEITSNLLAGELAGRTAALLKQNGLQLPVVYQGGNIHDADAAGKTVDSMVELANLVKPLGTKALVFNTAPKAQRGRKTDEELARQREAMTQMVKRVKATGLALLLHQHAPEMSENSREWRELLKVKGLGVCLDVHWILRGGQDVMALTRECGPRIGDMHLRNSHNGVWDEELGDGDVDYRAVAAYLKQIGYRGYLSVELAWEAGTKLTRPLVESMRRSRVYAEEVFGVKA